MTLLLFRSCNESLYISLSSFNRIWSALTCSLRLLFPCCVQDEAIVVDINVDLIVFSVVCLNWLTMMTRFSEMLLFLNFLRRITSVWKVPLHHFVLRFPFWSNHNRASSCMNIVSRRSNLNYLVLVSWVQWSSLWIILSQYLLNKTRCWIRFMRRKLRFNRNMGVHRGSIFCVWQVRPRNSVTVWVFSVF